jgi:MFS family permease
LFSRTKPWTSIERVDPSLEIPTSEKKRKSIACTKRILDKLDKISDKIVTGIKSISTRASWQGVLLVIITSTVYVGLLVVLAVLAGLWMQLFVGLCQWIIVSVGILVYTGFLFITFFRLRYEKLQEGTIEKWRGSTVQLVLLISSAVIGWILGVVGSIVIGVLIPVSNEWFGKLMVVSLSVTGMAILCTFAAILLFKNFYVQPLRRDSQDSTSSEFHGIAPDSPLRPSATPFPTDDALQMTRRQAIATNFMNEQMFEKLKKKSLISKIMDPIKETLKSQFIFPRWFIIVDFSICMVYCITLSVVLIIYGIKFDTGHFGSSDTQWLLGSGIGLGLDIFVSIPIFFIITNVVYIGLIQILQGIFFPVDKSKKYEMRVQEESTYDWSRKRPSLASQADSSVPEKMESALDLPIDASNIELDVL